MPAFPQHQLSFLVLSSSLEKVLTLKVRIAKAWSVILCGHAWRQFNITGFGGKLFWGKGTVEDLSVA